MSREQGTVEGIEEGWAWVSTRREESCAHCGHKGHCHMVQGTDRMVIKAKNLAHAGKGDEVELYLNTKTKLKGLFILYMFPVLGLLIGAFSADSLSGVLGLNRNIAMVAFTLSGLIIAFLLARFLAGRMEGKQKLTPVVSGIVRRADNTGPRLQGGVTDCAQHKASVSPWVAALDPGRAPVTCRKIAPRISRISD